MKKKVLIVLVVVLALTAIASMAQAGGGPNGTFVYFVQSPNYHCYSYWLTTGSGLVHEWRYGDPSCAAYAGKYSLHLVFKPVSKFEYADCDDEGYLGHTGWTFNPAPYADMTGDEADLDDFLTPGQRYWVCFYEWTE
jgi:hypothetical protein